MLTLQSACLTLDNIFLYQENIHLRITLFAACLLISASRHFTIIVLLTLHTGSLTCRIITKIILIMAIFLHTLTFFIGDRTALICSLHLVIVIGTRQLRLVILFCCIIFGIICGKLYIIAILQIHLIPSNIYST